MTSYDIFVLTTCLFVFILFVAICSFMVYNMVKNQVKLIKYGEFDEQIKTEYDKKKNEGAIYKIIMSVVNAILCLLFIGLFVFSFVINANQNSFSDSAPTMRVVLSSSMSKKLNSNAYLEYNGLDDQFQMYDIILTYKIPDEKELKLYDIVVYEVDEQLIVHRIVGIEEPNERHPNERWFTLQGDAVGNIDRFPVKYSQMRGIYRGERVRFAGSFVLFLQSPAGWLCLTLVFGATVLSPIIDDRIDKKKVVRLVEIGYISEEELEKSKNKRKNNRVSSGVSVFDDEIKEKEDY